MRIIECAQRSEKWYSERLGRITASNADRLLTTAKRATYQKELLAEILAGQQDIYVNDAMQWGIDTEAQARASYEFHTGRLVHEVGLCVHSDYDFIACSPDGFSSDGLVEIKCPASTKNHITHIESGPGSDYYAQMQFQMLVTDRPWVDFVSFDPRVPVSVQLHIVRIERDDELISLLLGYAQEVKRYIDEFKAKHGIRV